MLKATKSIAAVAVGVVGLMSLGLKPAMSQTITSSGPLTISVSPELNCDVRHSADASPEFYAGTSCGTFVAAQGALFGPFLGQHYTPVSQSTTTGDGSAANPFRIVTVADGASALRVTQTDTYAAGKEYYRTDVKVENRTVAPLDVTVYRAGDCYLQNNDRGFGRVDATNYGHAVACVGAAVDANGNPIPDANGQVQKGTRIEQWVPLTAGSHYFESGYSTVYSNVTNKQPFPDTCLCDTYLDNGAGLSWTLTIPTGGSSTVSHLTAFSPTGDSPIDDCGEDGLAALGSSGLRSSGLISGTVHNTVEPLVQKVNAKTAVTVHNLNCDQVVPLENKIDAAVAPQPTTVGFAGVRLGRR